MGKPIKAREAEQIARMKFTDEKIKDALNRKRARDERITKELKEIEKARGKPFKSSAEKAECEKHLGDKVKKEEIEELMKEIAREITRDKEEMNKVLSMESTRGVIEEDARREWLEKERLVEIVEREGKARKELEKEK